MESNANAAAVVKYIDLVDQEGQKTGQRLANLVINRPQAANSFNSEMMLAITDHLNAIKKDSSIRVLLLQSVGKHFSAGADLKWMQECAMKSEQENRSEAEKLSRMFEALYHLDIPTIGAAKGAVYGGAVGLIACCDYAFAMETAKFCLSEVRIGLIPAVIVPYLARKMKSGDLQRFSLTGKIFTAEQARTTGLIQDISDSMTMQDLLVNEVNQLLSASPNAQKAYKALHEKARSAGFAQGSYSVEAISKTRASEEGKGGLAAFFSKSTPAWVSMLEDQTPLFEV